MYFSAFTLSTVTRRSKRTSLLDDNPYKGVALINTITKRFTSILVHRLITWTESYDLLPEHFAGFRKRRECIDHKFLLTTCIQIQLRSRGRKVYAIFVDLRKLFDLVIHP